MSTTTKRPTIVCLCGSTRFWREFQRASLSETMAGRIVLSIGAATGTDDEHFGNLPREEYDRVKAQLDELHLRKIDLADEILVLNVGGYTGESTRREIAHAFRTDKRVRWLEPDEAPDPRACGAKVWLDEKTRHVQTASCLTKSKLIDRGGCPDGCCDDYQCPDCGKTFRIEWPD